MRSRRARADQSVQPGWQLIAMISDLLCHIYLPTLPVSLLGDGRSWRSWQNHVMEQPVYDAGIAGSMTMIFLTVAMLILLRSFYKRWKRMDERRINDETK